MTRSKARKAREARAAAKPKEQLPPERVIEFRDYFSDELSAIEYRRARQARIRRPRPAPTAERRAEVMAYFADGVADDGAVLDSDKTTDKDHEEDRSTALSLLRTLSPAWTTTRANTACPIPVRPPPFSSRTTSVA